MKMNKKGFTLAELLIVIAIIAVLIAIAIPVFSGQLDNAKLQADHANLRSAYAQVQTLNLLGPSADIIVGYSDTSTTVTGAQYCTDGRFHSDGAGTPVKIQAESHPGTGSCESCVVDCKNYVKDDPIKIVGTAIPYDLNKVASATPGP